MAVFDPQEAMRQCRAAAERIKSSLRERGVISGHASAPAPSQLPEKVSTFLRDSVRSDANRANSSLLKMVKAELPFTRNVDINENKNRYNLTATSFQERIQAETGALLVTRGRYYPERGMATDKDPPLYIHVAAPSQEALDAALKEIDVIMNQEYQLPEIHLQPERRPSEVSKGTENA